MQKFCGSCNGFSVYIDCHHKLCGSQKGHVAQKCKINTGSLGKIQAVIVCLLHWSKLSPDVKFMFWESCWENEVREEGLKWQQMWTEHLDCSAEAKTTLREKWGLQDISNMSPSNCSPCVERPGQCSISLLWMENEKSPFSNVGKGSDCLRIQWNHHWIIQNTCGKNSKISLIIKRRME